MSEFSLFQVDLDECESGPVVPQKKHVERGRRVPLSAEILGRCTRCGSGYTDMYDYCPDCLNFGYCDCDKCQDIGGMHVMVLNIIWRERHEKYEEWQARCRSQGKTEEYIALGLARANYFDEIYIAKKVEQAKRYRNAKLCGGLK